MKVILDSNVIISAFATKGLSHLVFNWAIQNCQVFISQYILNECTEKLSKKLKFSPEDITIFRNFILKSCLFNEVGKVTIDICRDFKDNHLFQLYEMAITDILVSGDKDILELKDKFRYSINSVREFYSLYVTH